jgi:hypothetical protein
MKKLTMEDWEKKYIAGDVKRFDQKYIIGTGKAITGCFSHGFCCVP